MTGISRLPTAFSDRLLGISARMVLSRTLSFPLQQDNSWEPIPAPDCMLYIHIPYCQSLCPFCTFHRGLYDEASAGHYFEMLRREISSYHELGFSFSGLYVGGGTPTMNIEELCRTIEHASLRYNISDISIETNPNHLTEENIARLLDVGVRRLSVGVQTFDDGLLDAMGRRAPYGDCGSITSALSRAQGLFQTLNVDLIFNLPGQSERHLKTDVSRIKDLGLDQVSYYPLMVTGANSRAVKDAMGRWEPEQERARYELVSEELLGSYKRESAWCFSRKAGLIDEYIIRSSNYVGAGSGAFSYLNGSLYATAFSTSRYCRQVGNRGVGLVSRLTFTRRNQQRYALLTALFGGEVDLRQPPFSGSPIVELSLLQLLGVVEKTEFGFRVTDSGWYTLVMLMREFLSTTNNLRDQMRNRADIVADPVRLID